MKIIIASKNKGKLTEFQQLATGTKLEFIPIPEEKLEIPEESGSTFRENALIKAKFVSEYFSLPALADDSGLEVDALNGNPGIYSARYSSQKTDQANCEKLLENMRGLNKKERSARFRCCLLGYNQGKIVSSEGTLEGEIAVDFRGEKGFGYDPIFLLPKLGLHLAELDKDEKNKISHRSEAFKEINDKLQSLFN
ncbi:MAG TPA: RdgB/HAM1 family non-canonical purine NTP pyrophosphatase [SAR86 cluster bacterium]|nr:RdgB/HAM1 family non-canonical purine NTP pyrophosphatase [SAR86 cluster bacterium]